MTLLEDSTNSKRFKFKTWMNLSLKLLIDIYTAMKSQSVVRPKVTQHQSFRGPRTVNHSDQLLVVDQASGELPSIQFHTVIMVITHVLQKTRPGNWLLLMISLLMVNVGSKLRKIIYTPLFPTNIIPLASCLYAKSTVQIVQVSFFFIKIPRIANDT